MRPGAEFLAHASRHETKVSKKLFSIFQSRHVEGRGQPDDEVLTAAECTTSFSTSLHYYKRNLTPVKESFGLCNDKTPYQSNFQNYKGKLVSSNFRNEMVDSLNKSNEGSSRVKCITTDNRTSCKRMPDRVMQTYFSVEGLEECRKKPKSIVCSS
jgi:hypothetical protein